MELKYNEMIAILDSMESTLTKIEEHVADFSNKAAQYTATMQDEVATEASAIALALRDEILQMKQLIQQSTKKAKEGAAGIKRIEDSVRGGRLKV